MSIIIIFGVPVSHRVFAEECVNGVLYRLQSDRCTSQRFLGKIQAHLWHVYGRKNTSAFDKSRPDKIQIYGKFIPSKIGVGKIAVILVSQFEVKYQWY